MESQVQSKVQRNLELMKTLDDAWNAGPKSPLWETFRKRHTENVAVYWPGQPLPTKGRHSHDVEAVEFFKTFPHNHLINNPYKIFFGQGLHLHSGRFLGHNEGPDENRRWKDDSSHKQELPRGILHSRPLERQGRDSRRTTLLRSHRTNETDRTILVYTVPVIVRL